MIKTLDENFRDWECGAFGFGYGTGEEPIMAALKEFMAAIGRPDLPHAYDHHVLESAVTPTVAWLLINVFCRDGLIDYGTSPRFGWLSPEGERLKAYIDAHTVDEMYEIVATHDELATICYRDACNCGPYGYEKGRICNNPFWGSGRRG